MYNIEMQGVGVILSKFERPISWGMLEIGLVYLSILASAMVFGIYEDILLTIFFGSGVPDTQLGYFTVVFAVQFISTILFVFLFTLVLNKASLADLGIKGARLKDYIKYGIFGGLLLLILIVILGIPINQLQPDIEAQVFEEILRSITGPAEFMLLLVIGAVLAPLSEELFYRGMIYPVFRQHLGPLWGAVLAGIVFGVAHWDLWRTIPLAVGGAVLCYIYEKTGSIFASALAHGVWNGVMSMFVYFSLY